MKDLVTLQDWSKKDIEQTIDLALKIKKNPINYQHKLKQKTLAMIFEKNSTRTRISFEAGMTQLGGHAIFLDSKKTQLNKTALKDEIKCIEKYVDIIMARVYEHEKIEAMAKFTKIPIINGLSDDFHPCQILADLVTIKETLGTLKNIKIAYIGDGNNVCNSLIIGCSKLQIPISVATPKDFEPKKETIKAAKQFLTLTKNPQQAAKDADIVYTDTWISMGQEKDKKKKLKAFKDFKITKQLLGNAKFMHCLPAHRGYEVEENVIDSKQSIIYQQAENRLYAQNAVMLKLLRI